MGAINLDLLKSIPIPADIREGALALEARVERLRKKAITCYVATVIVAILGLTAHGLCVWLSPDVYISSPHIPDEVLKVFSDSVKVTGGVASGLQMASQSLGSYVSSLASFLAIGALLVGFGVGIVKQSIMAIAQGFAIALASTVGPAMLISVTDGMGATTSVSEKTQLIQMVNSGDISGVDQAFKAHKLSGGLGEYVLAQTMLIRKKEEAEDSKKAKVFDGARFKDLVLRVERLPQNLSKDLSPVVMMALEVQALGKTQSVIAQEYEKAALVKISLINMVERFIKVLTFVFMFLGVILLAIKTVMIRRLNRIGGLLNQHPAGKVDMYFRKPTKAKV